MAEKNNLFPHVLRPSWKLADPACLILILWAILFRLPFFFMSTIPGWSLVPHDEGLFLYQGIDVLDGYLPYLHHWDNRPPLGWGLYAILVALSFHTLWAFRIIGAIYIGLTAYVLYLAAKNIDQPRTGFLSAVFYIVITGSIQFGQAFTYDHLIGLPLAGMIYYVLNPVPNWKRTVKIGFLFAICCLILTNFILFFPALGLIFILERYKSLNLTVGSIFGNKKNLAKIIRGSAVDIGIVIYITFLLYEALWCLYAIQGYGDLLIASLFKIPLALAGERMELTIVGLRLLNFYENFILYYVHSPQWLIVLLTVCFIIGTLIPRPIKSTLIDWKIFILLFFSLLAIALRGLSFEYYLLQISAVISLAMGRTASLSLKQYGGLGLVVIAVGIANLAQPVTNRYLSHNFVFLNDGFYKIANIINTTPRRNNYLIYCGDEEILYTLTDSKDPVYVMLVVRSWHRNVVEELGLAHYNIKQPLNIKDALTIKQPDFVVGPTGHLCFTEFGEEFKTHYKLVNTIEGEAVYQRITP